MTERVVSELIVDARGAEAGTAVLTAALAKAETIMTKQVASAAGVGRAWDRLRASADPAVAATNKIQQAMQRADAAVMRGIATQQEAARVVDLVTARQERWLRQQHGAADATGLAAHQVQNLTFQVNDLATSLVSGQDPFRVLLQQGAQMVQVFGPGTGVRGALQGVGAAIIGFVTNPLNLVVLGLSAAAGAVSLLFGAFGSKGRETEDLLRSHADLVDEIGAAYKRAEDGVVDFGERSIAVLAALNRNQVAQLRDELRTLTDQLITGYGGGLASLFSGFAGLTITGRSGTRVREEFAPFQAAIEDLAASAAAGTPDVRAFQDAVAALMNTDPANAALQEAGSRLLELSDAAFKVDARLSEAAGAIGQIGAVAAGQVGGVEALRSALEDLAAIALPALSDAAKAEAAFRQGMGAAGDMESRLAVLQQFGDAMDRIDGKNAPVPRINPVRDLTSSYGDLEVAARGAAAAQRELDQSVQQLASHADGLIQKLFPEEAARRAADKLRDELGKFGAGLDPLQRQALQIEIEVLDSGGSIDRLTDKVKSASQTMADALAEGLGGAVQDLFTGAIDSLDDFLDRFTRTMAGAAGRVVGDRLTALLSGKGGGAAGGLAGEVAAGTQVGIDRAFGQWFKPRGNSSGGFLASPAGSALVQGVAGFSIGASTANPLTGALGGALSGFLSAGPVGAIVGGIAGALGGIFGRSRQQREQRQEAEKALDRAAQDLATLRDALVGNVAGSLTSTIRETTEKVTEYAQLLRAAGKDGEAAQLEAQLNGSFIPRLIGEFRGSFAAAVGALAAGLGDADPYLQAAKAVAETRKQLLAFVDDAKRAFGAGSGQVGQARSAARSYALSLIGGDGAESMSTYETEYRRILGARLEANRLLRDLGMTIADATRAVNARVAEALADLRGTFNDDVQRKLNQATGRGWMSDAADLAKEIASLTADARRLGGDLVLVGTYGKAAAQAIIDANDLTGTALQEFIASLPANLRPGLHAATAAVDAFTASIRALKEELLLDKGLSPLSPQGRLSEAERQFRGDATLAGAGDRDAMGRLADRARSYLNEARDYYASSGDYAAIFAEVQRLLDQAVGGARAGMAGGGMVGNGLWNRDSVLARFAGGGAIALAGGEYVTRATSVTPATYGVLDAINRTGQPPANDNGSHFAALGDRLTRALVATSTAHINALRQELQDLRAEVRKLNDTTRIEARRPARPGGKAA